MSATAAASSSAAATAAPAGDTGKPKQVVSRPKKDGDNNNNNNNENRKPRGRGMMDYLQRTLCISCSDGRLLVGRFVAFDPHMNVVLSGAHEYPAGSDASKAIAGKIEAGRRDVGLVVLRGEHVNSIMALKKKTGAVPAAVNLPTGASAVPGGQLGKTANPTMPKASGARRVRVEEEE